MSKILVTGATGPLGKAVVEELLRNTGAANIAVLARDPVKAADFEAKGVTVLKGDYNDYASLLPAFEGIDKLYFVSGNDVQGRGAQHENVVKAAVAAKVGHVFYTSVSRRTEDGSSAITFVVGAHLHTEALLKASGLTYTILKHNLYADMLPAFIGDKVLESGIYLPAGKGKVAFATRNDMGIAGAKLLLGSGHENKVYEIAGDTAYSFDDIATMLSDLSGKTITYISPSTEDYIAQLSTAGVPGEYAYVFGAFAQSIAQQELDLPDATLEHILGRKPESVNDYLKKAFSL
ncbi:SDR family oxidoreductase [Chitinophaga sp. 22321]|uniref:SDR family oxidoreductase n=1 Tax=Chitinophaga hostae TaxID=2831022 RepID=A0ABS5J7P3_9BACT|nr:SDR family oxidoreductase [Chitinophaga hostae]MBS0031234.1 SDR family oxidoreductase [Chitinophaga hostae]